MRVVVTGAASLIGSYVAEAMADAGHEVVAVDALAASPAAAARTWPGPARHGDGTQCRIAWHRERRDG